MTLHLTSPAALAGLLAIPLFFVGLRRTRRATAAAGCRAAAAVAVVLALAGLYVERLRPESGACIVAAIDVSASVQHAAAEAARTFLRDLLPRLGDRDLVGSVGFAAHAGVVFHPAGGRPALGALLPMPPESGDPEGADTDLAAALTQAAPLCPEGKQAALVLFTDGNETAGSLLAEATLAEPPVPVFPVLPAPAALPPAALRRLLAPSLAPDHTMLPLQAVIESRMAEAFDAALQLDANDEPITIEPVTVPPGLSVVPLPYRPRGPGPHVLEAHLRLLPGAPQPPGPVGTAVTVTGPLHVLVVSERPAPVVAAALARHGMRVEIVTAGGFAARVPRLAEYHVAVLDDVGRQGFTGDGLEALARHVARGGGLVATGGAHFFGDGGFAGTALERVLPVDFQSQTPEPEEREPIALYVLIDRSNSMGYSTNQPALQYGDKMEYAKRAAVAVLEQLGPNDLVGAIAFDAQPYALGALRPVMEGRAALETKIRQLQYGGGTDFLEALQIAHRDLVAAGAHTRHVLLLTDGDTNRRTQDHDEVIAALARDGVTVTSIRIGDDTANLELLSTISRATGGEFHHVENVALLPQLMIRDTQRLTLAGVDRRGARARIGEAGPILAGIAEHELPPVSRWALTRPKPGAELRLYVQAGDERDPLLVTWQYELGRAAVLPLDVHGGGAAWPEWPGFAKLWAQLALWAAPPGLAADRHLEARRLHDGTLIRLETVADDAGPFVLRVPELGDVALRPVGQRTFTAVVSALGSGVHRVQLIAGSAIEEPVDLVVPAHATSAREYRATVPNRALLEEVATLTGGRVDPTPAGVLAARPGVRHETWPLAGWLMPLVLGLVVADVALRRLAP